MTVSTFQKLFLPTAVLKQYGTRQQVSILRFGGFGFLAYGIITSLVLDPSFMLSAMVGFWTIRLIGAKWAFSAVKRAENIAFCRDDLDKQT